MSPNGSVDLSGKKRQTFDKMNRERAVKEKRARKQEKKDAKKLAAQAALAGDGEGDGAIAFDGVEEPEPAAEPS